MFALIAALYLGFGVGLVVAAARQKAALVRHNAVALCAVRGPAYTAAVITGAIVVCVLTGPASYLYEHAADWHREVRSGA